MQHTDALALLARETRRARRALALERAIRAGLPLLGAILVWAALALSGLHERLPFLLESLTAIAAWVGFAWLARKARGDFVAPSETEARARLARDSALPPSAFDALGDNPIRYDPFAAALWRVEQEAARKDAFAARARAPRPRLNDLDPFKLRFLLPLAALIAAYFAAGDAPERLARAFIPDPAPLVGDREMAIEAWATPAAYTGGRAISLSERVGQSIETPPGVEATVRLTGPTGAPLLRFKGESGQRTLRFQRAADGAWEAQMMLPGPGELSIVRFHTRARWRIRSAPDHAPQTQFTAPIANLPDTHVGFSWRAQDDYGVTRLALRVIPVDPPEGLDYAAPLDAPIDIGGHGEALEGRAELDMSAHPYAGLEVEARLVAFDALGQTGMSEPQRLILPRHPFQNPVALAALEIRRALMAERRPYRAAHDEERRLIPFGDIVVREGRLEILNREDAPPLQRAPEGVRHAARLLDALTMNPQDGYFQDLAVFLGLASARAYLDLARDLEGTESAADLLWRTALRAEYGGASDARRLLEEIQRQLAEALRSGASPERIRELMEALHRSTQAYVRSLVQEAVRRGQTENAGDARNQVEVSGRDLEAMMAEVQRLAEQGRNVEAEAMLQQLSRILDNLNVDLGQAQAGQSGAAGESEAQREMRESMEGLSQVLGEQRALGDETERERARQQQQAQSGQSGGAQAGGEGELAQRQAQIRDQLSQTQSRVRAAGAAPSPELDAAGQAMREAEGALRGGEMGAARNAQDRALDSLRQGAEQLAEQMRGQDGQDGSEGQSGARDPLGRLSSGPGNSDGDTAVPTEMDPARSREVFDEIRRRAEDPDRPAAERDYLRRLLERF